jgi:hypothetical protein
VSYQSQTQLSDDPQFQARVRGCSISQATVFKDDARPDFVALSEAIMRQENCQLSFFWLTAASPGFAENADDGEGGIDSSAISDADILASVQGNWPTVAALYFDAEGSPLAVNFAGGMPPPELA